MKRAEQQSRPYKKLLTARQASILEEACRRFLMRPVSLNSMTSNCSKCVIQVAAALSFLILSFSIINNNLCIALHCQKGL